MLLISKICNILNSIIRVVPIIFHLSILLMLTKNCKLDVANEFFFLAIHVTCMFIVTYNNTKYPQM